MGPVISRNQYDKSITRYGLRPRRAGGLSPGGGRPDTVGPDGWYVAPTVLAGMGPATRRRAGDLRAGAVRADLP